MTELLFYEILPFILATDLQPMRCPVSTGIYDSCISMYYVLYISIIYVFTRAQKNTFAWLLFLT